MLDQIVRDGARAMLAAALHAEVAAYVGAHRDEVDEVGHRLVVRTGYHAEREVTTAAGAVPVRAPRINDKRIDEETGERRRFCSAILPAWARKSPQVAEVLPLLYLHGLSSGDFGPALEQFLGSGAGLSAATITRLTGQWQDEAAAFNKRSLKGTDYVYVWVDGIHLKVRLEQDKGHCCINCRHHHGAGDLPVGCRTERSSGRPVRLKRGSCWRSGSGGHRPAGRFAASCACDRSTQHCPFDCSLIADLMRDCVPTGPVVTHHFPTNQRRHVEKLHRFPLGWLPLGDAVCSFDPIYGQGMTSAALQARGLADCLDGAADLDRAFSRSYFKAVARAVAAPWSIAAGGDFDYAGTTGKKPFGTDFFNRYTDKVVLAGQRDDVVVERFNEVISLVRSPESLLSPPFVVRVLTAARRVRRTRRREARQSVLGSTGPDFRRR